MLFPGIDKDVVVITVELDSVVVLVITTTSGFNLLNNISKFAILFDNESAFVHHGLKSFLALSFPSLFLSLLSGFLSRHCSLLS